MGCFLLFGLIIFIVIVVGMWKVFVKAGKPGWMAIIPFLNMFILTTEIAGKEILWFLLLFVPCVNIVAVILIAIDVAKAFGKGPGFGIGLAFLPIIFYPILGFGDARYLGPPPKTM
jgi:hypothetical protein